MKSEYLNLLDSYCNYNSRTLDSGKTTKAPFSFSTISWNENNPPAAIQTFQPLNYMPFSEVGSSCYFFLNYEVTDVNNDLYRTETTSSPLLYACGSGRIGACCCCPDLCFNAEGLRTCYWYRGDFFP